MNQQVNLYQPEVEEKEPFFPASMVAQFCLIAVVIFIGFAFVEYKKLEPHKSQLHNLQSKTTDFINGNDSIVSQEDENDMTFHLNNEIEILTNQLNQQKLISKQLTNKKSDSKSGYSTYLEALARGHLEDTWLTYINIRQGGALIRLEGKSLSSELVTDYIKSISSQQKLNSLNFKIIELAQIENNTVSSNSITKFLIGSN